LRQSSNACNAIVVRLLWGSFGFLVKYWISTQGDTTE